MLFNKPVKLHAYTADKSVFLNAKPLYGDQDEKPSFLKTLKASIKTWNERIGLYDKAGTVVVCPGIRDFLSTPINLHMWGEVDIRINPDGTWSSTGQSRSDLGVNIAEHHLDQWRGVYPGKRVALKLDNPWKFVCDKPINFVFTESHYSTSFFREQGIWLSPGVTNYKYQHSTNVHLNCPVKDKPYVITLKHGMPLVSLFPMTERKVDLETHKIDYPEWGELGEHMPKMAVGKYYKQQGLKK